jgi:hypothetical protein
MKRVAICVGLLGMMLLAGSLYAAKAGAPRPKVVSGEIQTVGATSITVKVTSGTTVASVTGKITATTQITLDGNKAAAGDLKTGQSATVTLDAAGNATLIAATSAVTK